MEEKHIQLTVRIPETLHKEVKILAIEKRTTLQGAVVSSLTDWKDREGSQTDEGTGTAAAISPADIPEELAEIVSFWHLLPDAERGFIKQYLESFVDYLRNIARMPAKD
jgi:hypothetical protein